LALLTCVDVAVPAPFQRRFSGLADNLLAELSPGGETGSAYCSTEPQPYHDPYICASGA